MIKNLLRENGTPITEEMRASLPQYFTNPFSYSPHPLCVEAMYDVCSYLLHNKRVSNLHLLGDGKMFGVLVVESARGELGYLAAYSGVFDYREIPSALDKELNGATEEEMFFVPPVYDLTSEESFFPDEESQITSLNDYIRDLEHDSFASGVSERIVEIRETCNREIEKLEKVYQEGKRRRDALKERGVSSEELAALIKESQFQKAEIKRAVKRMNEELEPYQMEWLSYMQSIARAKIERKEKSAALQRKIFDHFHFLNARGEEKSLLKIFGNVVPPAGAGECAAPRLLQYAYKHGFKPVAMGEFWYGYNSQKFGRKSYEFYPSCKSKCAPILSHMLQGLKVDPVNFHSTYGCDPVPRNFSDKIVYEDDHILAVDKPAGVLSVPGKDSNEKNVIQLMGRDNLHVVHRLDMHTSGILLFAKDAHTHKLLQQQFLGRQVSKCYAAVLDGPVSMTSAGSGVMWAKKIRDKGSQGAENKFIISGSIYLPLALDYGNRPKQCVDYNQGKPAITDFKIVAEKKGKTLVEFYPITGRTHQLRVHAAHPDGLNVPIEGDLLYGKLSRRLMLHAWKLSFTHPHTGEDMTLEAKLPALFDEMVR